MATNAFVKDGKRWLEYGGDAVCLDETAIDESVDSKITNWSMPPQTAVLFSEPDQRNAMVAATKFPCPCVGTMVFRAIVSTETDWRITPSYAANVDFIVYDPPTFGFFASTVEGTSSKLKRGSFELEKSSSKKSRFVGNHLKMVSHGCELTLQHIDTEYTSLRDLGWHYRTPKTAIRESQIVAFLIESFSVDARIDDVTTAMQKNALLLAAAFRVLGPFCFDKLREGLDDDITEAREFLTKNQNKKVTARSRKDAAVLSSRIAERLKVAEIGGKELRTSQSKNIERRRLLDQLEKHVE